MADRQKLLFVNTDADFEETYVNGGSIFIVDVQPVNSGDNVDLTYLSGTVPADHVVDTVNSDTSDMIVYVEFDGPGYGFTGTATINGIQVTNIQPLGSHTRRFSGQATIDIGSNTSILAEHSEGHTHEISYTPYPEGPKITEIKFVNGYPGSQTELKAGDNYDIQVTFDSNETEPTQLDIENWGASSAASFDANDLSTGGLDWSGSIYTTTLTITIANRGTSTQNLPLRGKAKNSNNTYGDTVATNASGGTVDGVNLVKLNNTYPSLSFGSKTYPSNQSALKNSETADVAFSYSDTDTIQFSSPNSQLSIANPTTLESTKTVTRIDGNYNISTNNLRAFGIRTANNASTTVNTIINIAHVAATITVSEPYSRLRSSSSGIGYTITITANQQLRAVPSLSAPEGSLGSFSGSTPGTTFTATLTVRDSDTKGTYSWQNLSAHNLANIETTSISGDDEYVIGGFAKRRLTVSAYSAEVDIGTYVTNVNKLVCTNLSEGDENSENFTYQSYTNGTTLDPNNTTGVNINDKYTITDPSNTTNTTGHIWFNLDRPNRAGNTTGTMQIDIEEEV